MVKKKSAPKTQLFNDEGRISKTLLYFVLAFNILAVAYFIAFQPEADSASKSAIFISQFASYLMIVIFLVVAFEKFMKKITWKQMMMRLLGIFGLIIGMSLAFVIAQVIIDILNISKTIAS